MDKEVEKNYEYKIEKVKRKKTKLEKTIIIISILFFIILMIYSNLTKLTPSKQDDFMEVAKQIEKYIEYNYMNCKSSNNDKEYDKDIINEDCSLKNDYSSKVIVNSGYKEEDLKEVIINFNSKKMRVIATEDGFYAGVNDIQLDLHID